MHPKSNLTRMAFLAGFLSVLLLPAAYGGTNDFAEKLLSYYQQVTWGPPTNGLQLGAVRFVARNVNRGERFRMAVFLGVPATSTYHAGLLPVPKSHRLDISLRDSAGNEARRTSIGDSYCRGIGPAVESRLKLERRGINLPAGTPFEYESFNLLDCFEIATPGRYTLTVRANLFRLARYPGIERVYLPPVSIRVEVSRADLDRAEEGRSRPRWAMGTTLTLAALCLTMAGVLYFRFLRRGVGRVMA